MGKYRKRGREEKKGGKIKLEGRKEGGVHRENEGKRRVDRKGRDSGPGKMGKVSERYTGGGKGSQNDKNSRSEGESVGSGRSWRGKSAKKENVKRIKEMCKEHGATRIKI